MVSVLVKIYALLCIVLPVFRKTTRRWMYDTMSRVLKQDHWIFMNYGFAGLDGSEQKPLLEASDEAYRLSWQLYDHLIQGIDLRKKSILEIGSGRGGGASMIEKYCKPGKVVGLDYSSYAVEFCKRNVTREGLSFVRGDAENLPFDNESFDTVINVESSHCYASMTRFLSEVKKVLRPGGFFLFTDFRGSGAVDLLERQLKDSGMTILKRREITTNVVKALSEDHDRRMELISRDVPGFFKSQFREFAGVKDSVVYKKFKNRDIVYYSYILQKT